MKNHSKKITIGLLLIVFIMSIVFSQRIKHTSNVEIANLTTEIETTEIEENITNDDENDEKLVEMEEDYLPEEKEEEIALPPETNAPEVKETSSTTETKKTTTSTVDISPITGEKYTVKKGDTLFLIAQRANSSINKLISLNNLSTETIYVGQVLQVKGSPESTNVASTSGNQSISRGSQREEDLYWLSRIIHAEAQGEPYQGKVAVGNVIINRVNNHKFPNTIYGVIFDKQDGYTQFSPVIDGTIYNTPDSESIKAATEVLNGSKPVGNALYFLNPRKSTNFWIIANRKFMKTIGGHDFYY